MTTTPLPITACAVVSACGHGTESLYQGLLDGRHRLRPPRLFSVEFPAWCGEVDDHALPQPRPSLQAYASRNARIALATIDAPGDGLREAVRQAVARYGAERVGVIIGTSTSGIYETENAYANSDQQGRLQATFRLAEQHSWVASAHFIAAELGLLGPCYAISTACSSSSKALASAQRLVNSGVCDAVLCGGVDSLCRLTVHGFHSLEIVSERPCTPLDQHRDGISLGEGCGLLLLERAQTAFDDCVHLLGCGESSDAHHMTAPHPQGLGAVLAMRNALQLAAIDATAIDYINLHATGTVLNDSAEMQAMQQVFAADSRCSGSKGLIGHTLGAAGAIETIITWLSIQRRFVPGSCNLEQPDPAFHCAIQRNSESDVDIHCTMNNNFGFGGNNSSVILGQRHD